MSFTKPEHVWATVEALLDADKVRATNRERINLLFNGDRPYTAQEETENKIGTNVNFLEGTEILHRARIQYENAFLKPENFFTIALDTGPMQKRQEWSHIITRKINRMMKRSPRYYHCLESQFAGVVLHGVAPVTWFRDYDWCPKPQGIEDVLVPSGTTADLENLDYFAVYQTYTMSQLIKATKTGTVDPGWKLPLVNQILKKLGEELGKAGNSSYATDLFEFPEKAAEAWKADGGYMAGDAVPIVRAFDFYFKDITSDKPVWKRKIILDRQGDDFGLAQEKNGILYENKSLSYGETIERIMHVQFADGSVVPPFRWHSVRSLGYQLYAICHLLNRLRCKLSDSVFESMMWYFRNSAGGDGEILEKIDLHHTGIIPDNLRWVSPADRHQVDFNLVGGAIGLYRELMQEHSSSYVRDVDASKQSEPETATAVIARVNQSSQLVGAMLTRAYTYQTYQYQEIVRRACTIGHKDCKKFRDECMKEGVPKAVFDPEAWDVIPERVLGAGNKMLEVAQADRLMAIINRLSPRAQRFVENIYITANTDNPQLAGMLAPQNDEPPSEGARAASIAWGTLVDGKPVVVAENIERIDYVETLLQMLAADIKFILDTGGVPDMRRIVGLANVIQHVTELVNLIAQDEGAQQKVKMYKDVLGKAQNEIKGFMQRLQEKMKAEQEEGQAETMAKVQSQLALTQAKIQALEVTTKAKLQLDQMRFQSEQQMANGRAAAEMQRQDITTAANLQRQDVASAADEQRKDVELVKEQQRADAQAVAENRRQAESPKE